MPKGRTGQRRPADVVSNAIKVARLATGEDKEDMPKKRPAKSEAAATLGKLGGAVRAKSLTAKKRSEIAKKAAAKRWERRNQGSNLHCRWAAKRSRVSGVKGKSTLDDGHRMVKYWSVTQDSFVGLTLTD